MLIHFRELLGQQMDEDFGVNQDPTHVGVVVDRKERLHQLYKNEECF